MSSDHDAHEQRDFFCLLDIDPTAAFSRVAPLFNKLMDLGARMVPIDEAQAALHPAGEYEEGARKSHVLDWIFDPDDKVPYPGSVVVFRCPLPSPGAHGMLLSAFENVASSSGVVRTFEMRQLGMDHRDGHVNSVLKRYVPQNH